MNERENKSPNFWTRFLIPAMPCRHGWDTFFCLTPTYAAFALFAELLSSAAWANKHENYSFLLDNLSAISGFFAGLSLLFAVFSAVRPALERARQKSAAAVSIHILNMAYGMVFLIFLFRFALLSWAKYSPILFYKHYRNEVFEYSSAAFFTVLAGALAAFSLSALFKSQKRLKTVSCAPALHNMFQAFGGMALCAAVTIALIKYTGADITLIAGCFLTAACAYCIAGMLRVFVHDMLSGDMTNTFLYGPLLYLPERLKLFDRNKSLEERIGLSFKFTWCAGYVLKLIPCMVLCGVALTSFFTCVYVVEPYQEAMLYRFGRLGADSVKSAGLHLKLPWPIDRVDIYDVSRAKDLQIGYAPSNSRDYLWISRHGGEEYSLLLGNGNELIAINLRVSYTISNLRNYVTRHASPENLLSSKVYEMMMRKTMSSDLNTVLSVNRKRLSEELTASLSEYADALQLGVHINGVMIASIHPAVDVAEVYQEVVSAAIKKETLISAALGDAEKTVNKSLQQSSGSVLAATARQAEKTALASKDMTVYEGRFFAYGLSPACYRFLKTMDKYQAAIKRSRVYVFTPGVSGNTRRDFITNGHSSILVK